MTYQMRSSMGLRCVKRVRNGEGTWYVVNVNGWTKPLGRGRFRTRYCMIFAQTRGKRVIIRGMRSLSPADGSRTCAMLRDHGRELFVHTGVDCGRPTRRKLASMLTTS